MCVCGSEPGSETNLGDQLRLDWATDWHESMVRARIDIQMHQASS